MKRQFANDLLNITLASTALNRYEKIAKDASEWLPSRNQCWFASRVVSVRLKYRLTIDRAEAASLTRVLAGCASTALIFLNPAAAPAAPPSRAANPLEQWDDNGNERISCAEARAHEIATVARNHPAYPYMNDADGDGVVCER